MSRRRVPGCWACEGAGAAAPRDILTWYVVMLHELLGHEVAAAYVLGERPVLRVVTARPDPRYL